MPMPDRASNCLRSTAGMRGARHEPVDRLTHAGEWVFPLSEYSGGNGAASPQTDAIGVRESGRMPAGAEDPIPQQYGRAVVAVGQLRIARMMPAVQLGHTEDRIQGAEPEIHIGVTEHAMHVVKHTRCEQQRCRRAEHDQRQQGQRRREKGVDRMETRKIQRIQPLGRVMDRVHPPQKS
jgi:hypothetical protein